MLSVDSTPELARSVYAKIRDNLTIVRGILDRPLTLSEKILFGHLTDPKTQEFEPGKSYLQMKPDRVALQDVLGQTVMLQFMQTKLGTTAVPTTVHCDHLIQARVEGASDLQQSKLENDEVYSFLKSASSKFGVGFWGPGAGIIHQVVLEKYAFPGALIIGTDSHTPNAGGLGACAIGVGGTDAVEVMAGLSWQLLYPKSIGVHLTGELKGWTAPKDVILYLAGLLTVSGGTNSIIEYFGPGVSSISCTGKATITNMGAELGATTSMFSHDERMDLYLKSTSRNELAELASENHELMMQDNEVIDNPYEYYEKVVEINLSELEPQIVGPHTPDRSRPISELATESKDENNGFVDKIDTALIGSCTNSSYEDLNRAADIARQAKSHGLSVSSKMMVTPGSEQIRATVERDGQIEELRSIGATVLANACGPCIGQWKRDGEYKENTIVTSYNRNFPRRNDGRSETMNFIGSPELVTALAIAGNLSFNPLKDELIGADGKSFRFESPASAPEVPANGFDSGADNYFAPSQDNAESIFVDPKSERLQVLHPWPVWSMGEFSDMPLLVKVQGKCTTDHISPAGPWLRYRGHLDKFSDNMFMGAVNAHTGETGLTFNKINLKSGQSISSVARDYKARSMNWVVIGDFNYGEGSSREHAAMSPRLLGAGAVIARSFARIHETNLKKHGLLALTFADPNDYEFIKADDTLTIINPENIASGKRVICIINHASGEQVEVQLNHSYSEDQMAWFKAGSALNVLHSSISE